MGPYAVGFKEFTTEELWNDCSVFYPVDKEVANDRRSDPVYLLRYPDSVEGLTRSFAAMTGWPESYCAM